MRIYHLKALVAVLVLSTVFLTGWAWHVVSTSVADLSLRRLSQPANAPKAKVGRTVTDAASPLSAVFARPLFRPDRRPFDASKLIAVAAPSLEPVLPELPPEPPTPPPVTLPPPPPVFPQITLRGVHLTGQRDVALLETPDFPLGRWLPVGSDLSNWHIKSISSDSVTFVSGELTQVLQLYVDNLTNNIGNPQ
jgi:hypothetical protein